MLLYKPSQWAVTPDNAEHDRRSIYLIDKRNLRLPFMEVFDAPDTQISCPRRESSTHAPQALELLNGRLSNEQAEAFAARLQNEAGTDPAQAGRPGVPAGRGPRSRRRGEGARSAVSEDAAAAEFALAMFNLNAFLYVN